MADDFRNVAKESGKKRPQTQKIPLLYAYSGGRVGHQPDQVSTIVVRTMHHELLAALAVATRLAMVTWPCNSSKRGVATLIIEESLDGEGTVELANLANACAPLHPVGA